MQQGYCLESLVGSWRDAEGSTYEVSIERNSKVTIRTTRPRGKVICSTGLVHMNSQSGCIVWGRPRRTKEYWLSELNSRSLKWQSQHAKAFTWYRVGRCPATRTSRREQTDVWGTSPSKQRLDQRAKEHADDGGTSRSKQRLEQGDHREKELTDDWLTSRSKQRLELRDQLNKEHEDDCDTPCRSKRSPAIIVQQAAAEAESPEEDRGTSSNSKAQGQQSRSQQGACSPEDERSGSGSAGSLGKGGRTPAVAPAPPARKRSLAPPPLHSRQGACSPKDERARGGSGSAGSLSKRGLSPAVALAPPPYSRQGACSPKDERAAPTPAPKQRVHRGCRGGRGKGASSSTVVQGKQSRSQQGACPEDERGASGGVGPLGNHKGRRRRRRRGQGAAAPAMSLTARLIALLASVD